MAKSRFMLPFTRQKSTDFTALFRPHIRGLYQSAYRWTLNSHDAEDLVQDLAETVMHRVSELASVEQPRSWLVKIMYHRFVDLHRRRKANPVVAEHALSADEGQIPEEAVADRDLPDEQLALSRLHGDVRHALNELEPDHRATIMLFEVEGYTIKEIADMLDIPEGTVKSRLNRARAKLKNSLTDGTYYPIPSCKSVGVK